MLLFVVVVACIALLSHAFDASSSPGLNVRSFGAKGDGRTDDTAAFVKALAAAARSQKRLYVPAGVYPVRRLRLPDGVSLKGASSRTTWVRGGMTFGSRQHIFDLKIGDAGSSAVRNVAGATGTVFERCHFRGGGGAWPNEAVLAIGQKASCSNLLFKDCEVERNLGVEDSTFGRCYNNISVYAQASTVRDITFEGCHVGVSNGQGGHDTGSPRMGIECWVQNGSPGWQNITLRGCVFEATDGTCLDFADGSDATMAANGVLVEGCTLKGAGVVAPTTAPSNTIAVECPSGVVIRNNTIYRSYQPVFGMSHLHASGPGVVITGNTFDLVAANGVTPYGYDPFNLMGYDNVFTGNTVTCNYGSGIVDLNGAHNNTVTGNTFVIGAAYGHAAIREYNGSSGNTVTPNTVD